MLLETEGLALVALALSTFGLYQAGKERSPEAQYIMLGFLGLFAIGWVVSL